MTRTTTTQLSLKALGTCVLLTLVAGERPALYEWVASYASARAKVASVFDYHPELLCGRATLHGPMVKSAPKRPEHHLSDAHVDLHKAHRLPIRQEDVWFISHEHRFIYLRGHKAGSTTITELLQKMFCKGRTPEVCGKPDVLYRVKYDDPIKGDEKTYMDYFVFAFVRNPFTRLASGYQHFANRLRKISVTAAGYRHARKDTCAAVPFSEFARDTYAFWRWCINQGCCPGKAPWLKTSALFAEDDMDMHFNDQSSTAFRPDGTPVVDFIGRVESFEEDWAEMWSILSKRNGRTYELHNSDFHANSGITPSPPPAQKSEFVNSCGQGLYEAMYDDRSAFDIALQYAQDFVHFGYPVNIQGVTGTSEQ